jgi:hypothetical protein
MLQQAQLGVVDGSRGDPRSVAVRMIPAMRACEYWT